MSTFEEYFDRLDKLETNYQDTKELILESEDFHKVLLKDLSTFMNFPIKEIRLNSDSAFSDDVGSYNQPYIDRIITEEDILITVRDIKVPEGISSKEVHEYLSNALDKEIHYEDDQLAYEIFNKASEYIIDTLDYYNFFFYDFTMKA